MSGRPPSFLAQRVEQSAPGAVDPAAVLAVGCSAGTCQDAVEAAEVVDADQVRPAQSSPAAGSIHQRVAVALHGRPSRRAGCPSAGRWRRNNPAARRRRPSGCGRRSSWKGRGCAQTSAESSATKIGRSPISWTPARWRGRRSASTAGRRGTGRSWCWSMASAQFVRAPRQGGRLARARGPSASRSSARRPAALQGHEQGEIVQPAGLGAAEISRSRLQRHRGAARKLSQAWASRRGLNGMTLPKSTRAAGSGARVEIAPASSRPSSTSRSGLIRSGLPAKAEKHW